MRESVINLTLQMGRLTKFPEDTASKQQGGDLNGDLPDAKAYVLSVLTSYGAGGVCP